MSPNKRIFLNIIATYGRSLYGLVIGLFCGRWTLMALGEVDYGLMGVVGGLTAFIGFFNGILATSVERYYAFSVGASMKRGNEENGLAECRRWFTVAVSIHVIVPVVLIVAGYPIGVWAIRSFLSIPPDRVQDCVWVFRFVCGTCFLGMVSVPFNAMYAAKQYIAELTIYSFATSTLNVIFLYYMISHPGIWLAQYAFWTCSLSVIPSLIIDGRALICFKECRIISAHLFNIKDIREMLSFAGWNFFGALGNLLKSAGMTVLVNKMLGPRFNASVSIANTVSGQTQTLAGSMIGAFMPAITNACGAGDRGRMVSLVHKTCKFGALLVLPFAIPLAIEIDEVMVLWLKNPPAHSGGLCVWLMVILILENMTTGHWVVVAANGRIALYQALVGICFVMTLPICWGMICLGLGIYAVGYSLLITLSVVVVIRIIAVKILLDIPSGYWVFRIFLPILGVGILSTVLGVIPSILMPASFLRILLTLAITTMTIFPLSYIVVLDREERRFVVSKVIACKEKVMGR